MTDDASATSSQRMNAELFRDVIGHFASGVTVITTTDRDEPFGTTASAVTSLSLEPPMLLVCLNQSSSTGGAIHRARRFAVNILREDQVDLASRFATKSPDKFAGVALMAEGSVPLLEGALAAIECSVREEVSAGTHTVFIAEVTRATATPGPPLAYFRGTFGRLDPAGGVLRTTLE
jgi:flavin reductase (DIM6/NTAB) family NADH-FMN oxidoreductase RutF